MPEIFVPRFVARMVVGRSEFFRSRFKSRRARARRPYQYRALARGYRDQVLCAFERDHRRLMRAGWFPVGSLRRWLDRLHERDAYPLKEKEIVKRNPNDIQQQIPEERMIGDALAEVENLGAHPLLTDVVVMLSDAQRKLAEWHLAGQPGRSGKVK